MVAVSDSESLASERVARGRARVDAGHWKGYRRIPKDRERTRSSVYGAVPPRSARAGRASHWLRQISHSPLTGMMNAHGRRNLIAVATALLPALDASSMTSMPGWDHLTAATGLSRSSITRHLRRLRQAGFLGVVASGRSAQYTPAATGRTANERAVYVLTIPTALLSVDKSDSPTGNGWVVTPYAREARSKATQTEPLRGTENSLCSAEGGLAVLPQRDRHSVLFPGNATVAGRTKRATREAQSLAVREMQRRVPALRPANPPSLAYACRQFFEAGWTVDDVLHALDNRPDSRPLGHDGANGIRSWNLGRWLAYRLAAWTDRNGQPLRSRSQNLDRHRHQAAAERRAFWERRRRSARPIDERESTAISALIAQTRAVLQATENAGRFVDSQQIDVVHATAQTGTRWAQLVDEGRRRADSMNRADPPSAIRRAAPVPGMASGARADRPATKLWHRLVEGIVPVDEHEAGPAPDGDDSSLTMSERSC